MDITAKLTSKYQTTIPKSIRDYLDLNANDALRFQITDDKRVLLTKVEEPETEDPVIGKFLDFLEQDMTNNPDSIKSVSQAWYDEISDFLGRTQKG